MSTKKARLIRTDNYKYLHYFNLYNSKETIKNNNLQNYNSYKIKLLNTFVRDNKSLLYSSVYRKSSLLLNKHKQKFSIDTYPIFMKTFLVNNSNSNYYNNYVIYNKKIMSINTCSIYDIRLILNWSSNIKLYLYKKQGFYFNNIYKHKIRHKYEKEDQNKLLYRKLNMNLLQKLN